jgi:predicted O-methyltransferase YrrM
MSVIRFHSLQCVLPKPLSQVTWDNIPEIEASSTEDDTLKFICTYGGSDKKIFEFGTWVGRSALGFSQNFQHVTTIDYVGNSDIAYAYRFQNKECRSGELVRDAKNVTVIEADSLSYDFTSYKEQYDVVFVDGNHSYDGCTKDLNSAMFISKPKSVIFVHDYKNSTMGVRRSVDDFDHPVKYYFADIDLIAIVNKG